VTGAAVRDVFHIPYFVLLRQGDAEVNLIGITVVIDDHRIRARGLLVAHVENLFARTKILFRRAVTAQAPLHLQTFLLVHERHLIHRAVAGVAADTFINVDAVVEVHKVGQLVDARPLQGIARLVTGADRFQQSGVGPDLRMAVHAGFGGRNARKARGLDRSVAVAAIDPEAGDVVLVAEGNRLRLANTRIGDIRRALDFHCHPAQGSDYKDRAKDGGPGQSIRTAMEDLRHSLYETAD